MEKLMAIMTLIEIELRKQTLLTKLEKEGIDFRDFTEKFSVDSQGREIMDAVGLLLGLDLEADLSGLLLYCVDEGITDVGEVLPMIMKKFNLDLSDVGIDDSNSITLTKDDFKNDLENFLNKN